MLQSIKYFICNHPKEWDNEDYFGYIYLTYDQKTGLSYVGKKEIKIEKSKDYYGSGTRIKRILKKRGNYFLKKIILGICYSRGELKYWETECKDFFNVLDPLYGYNIIKKDNSPMEGRKHSKESNQKNKLSHLGKIPWNKDLTKEIDERVKQLGINTSKSSKGKIPWNKNLKNAQIPWNKGLTKEDDERVANISNKQKNKKLNKETIEKIKYKRQFQEPPMKNKHHSEETKNKIGKANKNKIPHNKGKKFNKITRKYE